MYLTYGNKEIIRDSLKSMADYLEYIDYHTWDDLWARGHHFGDWLSLDAGNEATGGFTDKHLIGSAYLAYSNRLCASASAHFLKISLSVSNLIIIFPLRVTVFLS